jgi:uncharacterized membrane protein
MFPIYGGIVFMIMFVQWLFGDYPWWWRGLTYMVLVLVYEYIAGWIIRALVGKSPWDYAKETDDGVGSPKKLNFDGLICLEYAPMWFIEGLLAEQLYLWLVVHLIV